VAGDAHENLEALVLSRRLFHPLATLPDDTSHSKPVRAKRGFAD
jgi:hypothetical protein